MRPSVDGAQRAARGAEEFLTGWPLKAVGVVATVLVIIAAAAVFITLRRPPAVSYRGNVLDPPLESVDFRLTDQAGTEVSWAGYRGRVVALTFLYTSCEDVCPLTAAKLRKAHELLGEDAHRVALVAVTVDPDRDTVEQVRRYSQERDMPPAWSFLVGSEDQLRPLWRHYWANPLRAQALAGAPVKTPDHDPEDVIEHGAPVHLIDAQGRGRVVFSEGFQPEDLAADIRTLLRET